MLSPTWYLYCTPSSQATGIVIEMGGVAVEPEMEDDYKETMPSGHSWQHHIVTKNIWEAKVALDGGKVFNKTLTVTH